MYVNLQCVCASVRVCVGECMFYAFLYIAAALTRLLLSLLLLCPTLMRKCCSGAHFKQLERLKAQSFRYGQHMNMKMNVNMNT